MRARASREEINRVIAAVRALWLKHPEQRLGQLLLNLARREHGHGADVLWNLDEREILQCIDAWPPAHDPKTCTSDTCDYRSCK